MSYLCLTTLFNHLSNLREANYLEAAASLFHLKKKKIPVVIVLTQILHGFPMQYEITEVGSPFGKSVVFFT